MSSFLFTSESVTEGHPDKVSDQEIELLLSHIDFRPAAIIERLNLQQPIYRQTAAYGHFGRSEFPWEQTLELTPAAAPASTSYKVSQLE